MLRSRSPDFCTAPLNNAVRGAGEVSVQGSIAEESAVSVDPMPSSLAMTTAEPKPRRSGPYAVK